MLKPVEIEFLVKDNTRQGLSGVSGGLDGVEKDATAATKRIKELEATITRLKAEATKATAAESGKYTRQLDQLQRKLEDLRATAQKTDLLPKNAPQAIRTYNGLNVSIQQIARELPSLAMGPQMFFLAISNNLPIFTEQLAAARKEYDALVAAGQKGTPVWKQVLSSIVSWQTALAVGIMLSVTYGKEIGEWVKGLFGAKKAFDDAKKAAEGFHAAMAQGAANAQKELTELKLLYKVATDTTKSYDERTAAVEKLQSVYPSYFENLDNEVIMTGKAADRYEKLRNAILETAKARAAESVIAENQKQIALLEAAGDAYDKFKKQIADAEAAEKKFKEQQALEAGKITTQRGPSDYYTELATRNREAKRALRDARKSFFEELEKLGDDGKKLSDRLKDEFDSDVNAFAAYIGQLNKRMVPAAEKIYLDPRSANTAAKKRQREAEKVAREAAAAARNAAESARREQMRENAETQYAKEVLRQQQELDNLLVEQQENGFDRERAAIRQRYERRKAEYEQQEADLLKLIKRLRRTGANLAPDAEKQAQATTALKIAAAAKVRQRELSDVDKQEADEYDRLLANYESYLQGRERITRQYEADIARLKDPDRKDAAERAKKQALEEFTLSFASQFPEFEAWADRIVSMSAKKLKALLEQTRKELKKLQEDPAADQNALAKVQAKVVKLEKLIPKVENEVTDTKRWAELHGVLSEVIDTFNEVGEAVGGAVGEVIAVAGKLSGASLRMINDIKAYKTAASLGDSLGKASAILSVISSGIGILSSIGGFFGGGESSLERNLRLAREYNEELRIARIQARIDNEEFSTIFGDRLFDRYKNNIDAARAALEEFEAVKNRILRRNFDFSSIFIGGLNWNLSLGGPMAQWNSMAESIGDMLVKTRHKTLFRSAKYSKLRDLLPELFIGDEVDMDLLKKFVEEGGNTFEHLSQENQDLLKKLVDDWETYQEAIEAIRDYLSGIFGDLGKQLTDALVDAFENGSDAAESFTKSVGQALRDLAKNMIYSTTLGKIFEDAQKRVEEIYKSSGDSDTKFEQWTAVMQQLISDAMGQQDEFNRMWAEFQRIAQQSGISIDDAEKMEQSAQSGRVGAVQTVTQESFSRVEGLITSIQIHCANMDDDLHGSTDLLNQSLEVLRRIYENTISLPVILQILQRIQQEGLKVK